MNALMTQGLVDAPALLRDAEFSSALTLAEERPEIAASQLSDEHRAVLPAMLDYARESVRPAGNEELMEGLTQTCSLVGGGMAPEEKEEWIAAAGAELQQLPRRIAIDGLAEARRVCRWPKEIVPFVIAYAEDYPDRLRRRCRQVEALCAAAGVNVPLLEDMTDGR